MATIRVRFAPSPTGRLHLGSALTAVANAAFARSSNGTLVLRIDDTDAERSDASHTRALVKTLGRLGIQWDEGPIIQSERSGRYRKRLDALLDTGAAYPCFCSRERLESLHRGQRERHQPPRYDGRCRELSHDEARERVARGESFVIRLRVPADREFDVADLVRGRVASPPGNFDDLILRRSDGTVGYQFASVCDDVDLAISHVLRGEDHLPNTPRQLAIFAAMNAPPPRFAHLPLLTGTDGRKLSKRDPMGSVDELLDAGYDPGAIRAYLMELLGHGAVDPLSGDVAFAIERIPASSPRVSRERLDSIARDRIASRPATSIASELDEPVDERWTPLVEDLRASYATLGELGAELHRLAAYAGGRTPGDEWALDLLDGCLELVSGQAFASPTAEAAAWSEVVRCVRERARAQGRPPRDVLRPVRLAMTGVEHGPKLDLVLFALGLGEVRRRLADVRAAATTEEGTARG